MATRLSSPLQIMAVAAVVVGEAVAVVVVVPPILLLPRLLLLLRLPLHPLPHLAVAAVAAAQAAPNQYGTSPGLPCHGH